MGRPKQKPTADVVRAWMNQTRLGYRAASAHFGRPEDELRELCGAKKAKKADDEKPADPHEWLTVSAAALHFGITPVAVRAWIQKDKVLSRRTVDGWQVELASCEAFRAGPEPEVPAAVPPVAGPDPTTMSRREFWAAHFRALNAMVAAWLAAGAIPRGGDKIMVELRHAEEHHAEAVLAEEGAKTVDDLPVAEQIERLRVRISDWPEQMLLVAGAELSRRWKARLLLIRPDGSAELGEDETWREVVQ